MSHPAVNWAIEQRVGGPSPKATLWSIANYANELWCSWPSQKTIAEDSEQSPDTVQRRIRELEAGGFIRRIPLKFAGRRSIDFFILKPSRLFFAPLHEIEPYFPRGYSVSSQYAAADRSSDAAASCGKATSAIPPMESDVPGVIAAANAAANATAQVRQQNQGTLERRGGGEARGALEPSAEAFKLSAEIARICGYDLEFLPPRWARDGARFAQAWLEAGFAIDMMRAEARLIMAHKRDGAPTSISYFDKPFARAHALRARPHQIAKVDLIASNSQELTIHDDWKKSRDRWRRAAAQFSAGVDAMGRTEDAGGEGS